MSTPRGDSATASAYDVVAASYARALPDDGYEAPLDRAMIADFAERVGLSAGRRVVDAGSGAGRMAPVLAGHGLRYVGADLSPGMVGMARALHPGHHFVVGTLKELPMADHSADGILAWYSIIHMTRDELAPVFGEFRRVLRPRGALLLGFQAGRGERTIGRAYGHDIDLTAHLHEPVAVQQQLAHLGFSIDATLVRAPRPTDRNPQAMILAGSHGAGGSGP